MMLLFRLAQWHALAKLRMHTDVSLDIMDDATVKLGQQTRKFQAITCKSFQTHELAREAEARMRRQSRKQATNVQNNRPLIPAANQTDANPTKLKKKIKSLNLNTYKFHAMGDYVNSIRLFGTTDSYSTQIVSNCSQILVEHSHYYEI
jgi:hypothetical protein